jgi:hypothetical protein
MRSTWDEWSQPPRNPVFIKHARLFRYPPVVTLELAPGWAGIVDSALDQISALLTDEQAGRFRTRQIKEKTAQLWWSWDVVGVGQPLPLAAIDAVVQAAQYASATACQECGRPSRLRRIGGYFYSLCEEHDQATRYEVASIMGCTADDLTGELKRYLHGLREERHPQFNRERELRQELVGDDERQAAIDECIAKVAAMMHAAGGDPCASSATVAFLTWAQQPVPALGGRTPMTVLEAPEGRQQVLQLLDAIGGSAYL